MFFYLLFLFFLVFVTYFYRVRLRKISFKKKFTSARPIINDWMQMTREERKAFDEEEKITSLKKRKLLLSKIRKEYQEVSKLNKNKGKRPFFPIK